MAQNFVNVYVRLKDTTREANRINEVSSSAPPLILRMLTGDSNSDRDFIFPYSPREINVGKLSDEMVQIARPGTTPIVAFKSHNLMTIDFTALIAYPGDGMIKDVEMEMYALRQMASSSNRVFQLLNYDIFTYLPFTYRNMSAERQSSLFFSITEMSVDVVRRNKDNKITSANVKISLVENRNPKINITLIPPIKFKKPVDNCKVAKYAKKYPNKCKPKKTDAPLGPSASESSETNANRFIAEQKAKGCEHHPKKFPKWICPGQPGYGKP
jgi:hypothetical protein